MPVPCSLCVNSASADRLTDEIVQDVVANGFRNDILGPGRVRDDVGGTGIDLAKPRAMGLSGPFAPPGAELGSGCDPVVGWQKQQRRR